MDADEINPEILRQAYLEILRIGMENLRRYSLPENFLYLESEIDHLHNIPSYIAEVNVHRHFYYFCAEKNLYLDRLAALDTKIETERLITWYKPHWQCIHDFLQPYKILLDDHRLSQWRD
ncbi:hypothetical protein SAMN02745181_0492 [Rubritalea squalenifaciens DSM 18772]|uniref:Uncharacterized protein n=1 Tax=Rubritalea squalenifaciens DSM 18772 TaxID=1123071 RepID=A0A1M6CIW3_9BACT|nr:hypothetical protein [Rubritalea squalenifaciens]SHI60975.1 hypothetical protein SAMN02745181_0492 [Rubritalea squalenifaciens DSM 18772]